MRPLSLPSLAWLALAAAALPAAAQAPSAQPMLTVTIVDLPPGPASVLAGQSEMVSFRVQVEASGFQCAQEAMISVDLALTGAGAAPAGLTLSIEPPNITFRVPPGAYLGLGQEPLGAYNESASATLRVATTPDARTGPFQASVSAAYAGGQPMGCVGTLPQAQDTKTHTVDVRGGNVTQPPPTGPPTGNETGNTTQPPPEQPRRGLPGFGPLLVAGAAALVALAARRPRA